MCRFLLMTAAARKLVWPNKVTWLYFFGEICSKCTYIFLLLQLLTVTKSFLVSLLASHITADGFTLNLTALCIETKGYFVHSYDTPWGMTICWYLSRGWKQSASPADLWVGLSCCLVLNRWCESTTGLSEFFHWKQLLVLQEISESGESEPKQVKNEEKIL